MESKGSIKARPLFLIHQKKKKKGHCSQQATRHQIQLTRLNPRPYTHRPLAIVTTARSIPLEIRIKVELNKYEGWSPASRQRKLDKNRAHNPFLNSRSNFWKKTTRIDNAELVLNSITRFTCDICALLMGFSPLKLHSSSVFRILRYIWRSKLVKKYQLSYIVHFKGLLG